MHFLLLEKSRKTKIHLQKIRKSEDLEEKIVDSQLIRNEFTLHYTVGNEQRCLVYLEVINTPKLSLDDQIKCKGKLTV